MPYRGDDLIWIDGFNQKVATKPASLSLQDRICEGTRDNRVQVGAIGPGSHQYLQPVEFP